MVVVVGGAVVVVVVVLVEVLVDVLVEVLVDVLVLVEVLELVVVVVGLALVVVVVVGVYAHCSTNAQKATCKAGLVARPVKTVFIKTSLLRATSIFCNATVRESLVFIPVFGKFGPEYIIILEFTGQTKDSLQHPFG